MNFVFLTHKTPILAMFKFDGQAITANGSVHRGAIGQFSVWSIHY